MEHSLESSSTSLASGHHARDSSRASPEAAQPTESLPEIAEKIAKIRVACQSRDLEALVDLATTTGGLLQDDLRRTAWPILLGCEKAEGTSESPWRQLPVHRDEEQVAKDVDRAFVYYPKNLSKDERQQKQSELSNIITEVLRRHPDLCYFQGYHDIVQVMLLVVGYEHATTAVTRLSILRIRDFMLPTLTAAIAHLRLLPAILWKADRELCKHIQPFLSIPYYALAPTLTLYAHNVERYQDIVRLFDFLLAKEPVMPLYLFAAIMLAQKEDLLEVPADETEMMYFHLQKLSILSSDIDTHMSTAISLYDKYPPNSLPFGAWRVISPYSVLKTSRNAEEITKQDLTFGERMFVKHATQLRRQEALEKVARNIRRTAWLYRRPIGATTVAILAGVIAFWLGRGHGTTSFSFLWASLLYKILPRW